MESIPVMACHSRNSIHVAGISAFVWAAAALIAPVEEAMPCVDVQIGDDRSAYLNCINQAMARTVSRQHETLQPEAPAGVSSSPHRLELFNETAARQQMGDALGVSSIPQRPKRIFIPPLSVPIK